MTLTAVGGVAVGHWTDERAQTGCTVVVLPEPNVAAVEVRGAAPGTRETELLRPGMRVTQVNAILLAGGSAFGLAAADGVMAELESAGFGHETPFGRVPIVPTAVIYDLNVGDPTVRPGPDAGRAAYRAASTGPVVEGRVGVGAGATAGKWRGFDAAVPTGVFSAAASVDGAVVAALVVVNAVGDIDPDFDAPPPPAAAPADMTNTTLGVIATNARLDRTDLLRLCVRAHDALSATIYPVHTRYDGDAVFAVSAGQEESDVDRLGEAAFAVTRAAILRAVR